MSIAVLNQTLIQVMSDMAVYQKEVDTMYLLICGALVVFSTYSNTHTHTYTPQTHVVFTNKYNSASRICDD